MTLPDAISDIANQSLPKHVAIIMDGNGRWAQQRGKIRVAGHKAGVASVRQVVSTASRMGIKALTLFAFSSENWRRPETEVSALMELFMFVLAREVRKLHDSNIRLRVIGDIHGFSERLQKKINEAESLTAHNDGLTLNIAANYGGRWDIVQATQKLTAKICDGSLKPEQINEALLAEHLSMADIPDVDLLIRTGGDHRVSNFLLWQIAYAELFFTPVLWPDFGEEQFLDAIASFISRERRFGCTGDQIKNWLVSSANNS
ncbi:MAG: polyprenyl diphosphate synthase [Tolumonas sp.]|uniref:polyprenyl diphosphate synthase n=1 Tax=uncultured Tolumonas sp. TaxID=263765 RepID=UPI002A0A44C2|nr:polyprenyl diphosphate synthase [uncultured Tolumonas sp.]MDD2342836.1 polyprenyl diphosphate synthase [Tolumonas sp.]MDD2842349.1 polyprenyl diphosphate synthase [Tolumonas sp.]